MRPATRTLAALLALAIPAAAALAGPLNPPAGPVAPTMKTLAHVEPRTPLGPDTTPGVANVVYRITQPGSYYLTGDVVGVSGKSGIRVEASNVTIDLNGFTLRGVSGSFQGIETAGPQISELVVRNGTVQDWGQTGVVLGAGGRSRATDITVLRCGGPGLVMGADSVAEGCISSDNLHTGIIAAARCTLRNCTASGNTLNGIAAGDGSVVDSCRAHANSANGLVATAAVVFRNCTATNNAGDGIRGAFGSHIAEVIGCTAQFNQSNGIQVFTSGRVLNCTAGYNVQNGIQFATMCIIKGNTCNNNGYTTNDGAGIFGDSAANGRNIIEGNTCTLNPRGIDLDSPNNLVIRNACTMNTVNFDIAANNRVGTIVVAPLSGAISGNTGAAGTGATDPMANSAY